MNKRKTFRVLCLFDYNATTGFATVSQNIVTRLEREFNKQMYLDIMAVNFFGEPYKTNYKNVLPASKVDKNGDPFGRNEFCNMLNNFDYDAIFIINDPGVITPLIPLLKDIQKWKKEKKKKQFKSIFYFPIDAPYLQKEFGNLDFFDLLVPYTQYAKNEIVQRRPELKTKMKVILHGVNTKDFMQVSEQDRNEFREAYFGKENFERHIIGNINRNQPRKDIPGTIFSFMQYREDYDDNAMLYLHMNPHDPLGHDLRAIINQVGLEENKDVFFPTQELIDNHPDAKFMCMIYNALDVFLTTTTGEGFGLTVLEAMQCGVPVIAPYHSSLMELHTGLDGKSENYYALQNMRYMSQHFDSMVRYMVDPYDVSDAINQVRQGTGGTHLRVSHAQEFAASLSWDVIVERWADEFRKLI